jgi:predicted nucleotidyltransferase component of viral defense system
MAHDPQPQKYYEEIDLFREALIFTASATGFSSRLIEKDYYCSIMLHALASVFQYGLVFKGGTCLSKVFTDFYRLSEDLDFVIPTEINSSRSQRRTKITPLKTQLDELPEKLPCLRVAEPLAGSNNNRQYSGRYAYRSLVTGEEEFITVEIGLREPLLEASEHRWARTLLIDPFKHGAAIEPVSVNVLSIREAYAEKIRAALTRREPAIRDFYDIAYAVRSGLFPVSDARFLELVRAKLAVPGNESVNITAAKLAVLRRQLAPQLQPVLRTVDYENFDLDNAFEIVGTLANMLQ